MSPYSLAGMCLRCGLTSCQVIVCLHFNGQSFSFGQVQYSHDHESSYSHHHQSAILFVSRCHVLIFVPDPADPVDACFVQTDSS